jgi:hypothetical protein
MGSVVGTIRKVAIDGISFDALADANVSMVGGKYTNESVPTSGVNMRKMVRRSEAFTGLTLATTGAEREILKGYSEAIGDIPITLTLANGDLYVCTGWLELEHTETETGKSSVALHPRDGWEPFTV